MLLAVGRCLAFKMKTRLLVAKSIGATPAAHVHHAVLSMLLAVRCQLAAHGIKGRSLSAGVM